MTFGLLFLSTIPLFQGELAYSVLQDLVATGERYYGAKRRQASIASMKKHFACPNWVTQRFEVTEPVSGVTYNLENHICRFQPENNHRVVLGRERLTLVGARALAVAGGAAEEPGRPSLSQLGQLGLGFTGRWLSPTRVCTQLMSQDNVDCT